VVGKLLDSQFSKRVVMLNAVLELAGERCPGAYRALAGAYRLIANVHSQDRAAVHAVLTHPSVGTWAVRCLRRLQGVSESPVPLTTDLGQLAAIAAAAAIRAGHAFTIEVPMRDGGIMLPTLGLATLDTRASVAVTVSSSDGCTRIEAGNQSVAVPSDPAQDADGWQGLRRLRSRSGDAAICIDLDDVDPARAGEIGELSARCGKADLAAWQSALDDAWTILSTQYPRRAGALAAGLRAIVPLRSPADGNGSSATARNAFGGIEMTLPTGGLRLADTLIHEFHHSALYAVMDLIPLHSAGPEPGYYSPWRDDPRPIEGLLHGAYAYLGVVDFWRGQRSVLTSGDLLYADFEFARWRRQVADAVQVLLDSGTLTKEGVRFAEGMAITAARWLELPVDARALQLADRATADHYIRWRLRNRRPDPVAVTAITKAWLSGQPCPMNPGRVPATVVPQQRKLALGERVRLLGLRLADPDGLSKRAVSADDLAYVRDDFVSALDQYRAAIVTEPQNIEKWTGLALTLMASNAGTGLAAAPEVAFAVYLDADAQGTAPDVRVLDRWLARTSPGAGIAWAVRADSG
jgi:HEXXH motif-containing protein